MRIMEEGGPEDLVIASPPETIELLRFYLPEAYKTDHADADYFREAFQSRLRGSSGLWLCNAGAEETAIEKQLTSQLKRASSEWLSQPPIPLRLSHFTPSSEKGATP